MKLSGFLRIRFGRPPEPAAFRINECVDFKMPLVLSGWVLPGDGVSTAFRLPAALLESLLDDAAGGLASSEGDLSDEATMVASRVGEPSDGGADKSLPSLLDPGADLLRSTIVDLGSKRGQWL